jgi:hypothetical protein
MCWVYEDHYLLQKLPTSTHIPEGSSLSLPWNLKSRTAENNLIYVKGVQEGTYRKVSFIGIYTEAKERSSTDGRDEGT